ncbi:hypothetical protein N9Y17_04260 [Gammaproteobacteria bacterium]|nr:hypothetical protein [Gammaproteobacteria bacterium]
MKKRNQKAQQKKQVTKNKKIELMTIIDVHTHCDKSENPLRGQELKQYEVLCQNTVKAIGTVNKDISKKLDLKYIKQLYSAIKGEDSFSKDNKYYEKSYENDKELEAQKILFQLINSKVETKKKYKTILKIESNNVGGIKLIKDKIKIDGEKTKLTNDNVVEKVEEILEKLGTNSFAIKQDIKKDKFEKKVTNILNRYEEQIQPSKSSESVSSNPSSEPVVEHIATLLSQLAKVLDMSQESRHLLGIILQKELKRHDLTPCMYYNYDDLSFFDDELTLKTTKLGMVDEKDDQKWHYISYQDFHSIRGRQNNNSIGAYRTAVLNYETTRNFMVKHAPEDLTNQPEKKQVEKKPVLKTIKVTGKKDDFATANKRVENGKETFIKYDPNQRCNINSVQFFKESKNGLKGINEDSSDSESQNSYSNISSSNNPGQN